MNIAENNTYWLKSPWHQHEWGRVSVRTFAGCRLTTVDDHMHEYVSPRVGDLYTIYRIITCQVHNCWVGSWYGSPWLIVEEDLISVNHQPEYISLANQDSVRPLREQHSDI